MHLEKIRKIIFCLWLDMKYNKKSMKSEAFSLKKLNENGLVWFVGFYGLSTLIGYLMPNPF